eukprot:scaffold74650_cov74-Cyclotella_meneghiniana.AAC.1
MGSRRASRSAAEASWKLSGGRKPLPAKKRSRARSSFLSTKMLNRIAARPASSLYVSAAPFLYLQLPNLCQ